MTVSVKIERVVRRDSKGMDNQRTVWFEAKADLENVAPLEGNPPWKHILT